MSRIARLLALLGVLLVLLIVVLRCSALPGPTRPEVLPGSDATRKVFDLLQAPTAAQVGPVGALRDLPGTPQRYLIARLVQGRLTLGWSAEPSSAPDETLTFDAPGLRLEAYVDLHADDRAVVEVWKGYTPDGGRLTFEIVYSDR